MSKMVTYNGGTESYYGCSSPLCLEKGRTYKVVSEEDRGCQTNYTLKGVDGYFNSVWFDEIPTYLAYGWSIPVKGESLRNFVRIMNGQEESIISSSTIKGVENIVNNVYKVHTRNTIYILQVYK